MADGNGIGTHPDLFDDETQDLLPLTDIERLRSDAELAPELSERLGQAQVVRLVDGGELQRV